MRWAARARRPLIAIIFCLFSRLTIQLSELASSGMASLFDELFTCHFALRKQVQFL